ncbi:hypothetical protein D3C75_1145560 [compost metagenome]
MTARAKIIFCQTILRVRLAIPIAAAIFDGSSVIITISAASMAASEPRPPIAIPTSALASTGVSLMPSPTKIIFSRWLFPRSKRSIASTLCCGSSPA